MTTQQRRIGLFLAGLATLALAGSALALPPAPFEGKTKFRTGKQLGAAVWHDAKGLHVRFTTKGKLHRFKGTVCTEAKITDLKPVKLEKNDVLDVGATGKCIEFRFTTKGGLDGFNFRAGGAKVTFDMALDGAPLLPKNIWIGDRGMHPGKSPFVLNRRGNRK